MPHRKRRLSEKLRSFYLWHRYAGLAAALLAIWLAVTGLLLNHTDELEFNKRFIENTWLLDAYNIEAPRALEGISVSGHWLVNAGSRVYLDRLPIAENARAVGAAATAFGFVIALPDRLHLYTPEAVLIEELPFTSADKITGIASAENGGVLVKANGAVFQSDAELIEFTRIDAAQVSITIPAPELESLPDEFVNDITQHMISNTLSWERALLDLHSGRLFGVAGKWLADIAGMLLLLLAVSGVIIWHQRWRH